MSVETPEVEVIQNAIIIVSITSFALVIADAFIKIPFISYSVF